MVSVTVKATSAVALVVLGILVVFGATVIPTNSCKTLSRNGEVLERNCEADQSLATVLNFVMGAGAISVLIGMVGVWRVSDSLGRVSSFVGGGVLILTGLFVSYNYGAWFWSIFSEPDPLVNVSSLGLLSLLVLAGVGLVIGLLGCKMWWGGFTSSR